MQMVSNVSKVPIETTLPINCKCDGNATIIHLLQGLIGLIAGSVLLFIIHLAYRCYRCERCRRQKSDESAGASASIGSCPKHPAAAGSPSNVAARFPVMGKYFLHRGNSQQRIPGKQGSKQGLNYSKSGSKQGSSNPASQLPQSGIGAASDPETTTHATGAVSCAHGHDHGHDHSHLHEHDDPTNPIEHHHHHGQGHPPIPINQLGPGLATLPKHAGPHNYCRETGHYLPTPAVTKD